MDVNMDIILCKIINIMNSVDIFNSFNIKFFIILLIN